MLARNGRRVKIALSEDMMDFAPQSAEPGAVAGDSFPGNSLYAILDSLSDGVLAAEAGSGRLVYANPTACRMLGYSAEELQGMTWADLHPPETSRRLVSQWEKARQGTSSRLPDVPVLCKDGHSLPVAIQFSLLDIENSKCVLCVLKDPSARKPEEGALPESAQISEGILRMLPARVFWKDKNLVYLGCNEVFAQDAGFADPRDLVGKDDYQMSWHEQAELYRADDRQVMASGMSKLFIEEPQTTPDGRTISLLTSKIPLRNDEGEITGVLGTYLDVTERQQAAAALRESKERYDQLAEQSRTIAWELDAEGRYTYVSHVSELVLGYRPDEMVGRMHFYDLFPEEGREEFKRLAFEAGRRNERFTNFLNPALTKDGRMLWLSSNGIPLLDAAGKLRGFRGSDTDVTARKQMEEGLKTSRRLLAEAMDMAHLVNWEFDVGTGLFTFDDRFYALYGTTAKIEGGYQMPAEVYAKKFVHPEDQDVVASEVGKAIRASNPAYTSQVDHRMVRRDGAVRHIVVRSKIEKDENGKTVKTFGVNQDITERKRAEEERRKMAVRLRELAQHLQTVREEESRRLSVWLHDEVGQMLTRARMDAMLLEAVPGNASGEAAAALSSLKRTLDDTVGMIQNICMDLRPAMLDDFGLVATLEWTVRENEKRLKIPIQFAVDHVPESLDDEISVAIYRMTRECLTNIARHAHATGVDIRFFGDGHWLSLVVRDNGCGMKPGVAESPTSFGLSQLRERASTLGGFAQIESRPGEGTTVRIALPAFRPENRGGRP